MTHSFEVSLRIEERGLVNNERFLASKDPIEFASTKTQIL